MRSRRVIAAVGVLTATAAVAVAVAVASTIAGGATPGSRRPAPGRPSVHQGEKAAREALAAWAQFPAGTQPRPLVIPVDAGIVDSPRDQHESLAIYHARWALAAPRPTDVAVARRHHWISSAAAIAALRDDVKRAPTPTATLTVRARLGRASFVTDRGKAELPAWQFAFGRFRQRASVLAPVAYKAPQGRLLDPDGVGNSEDGELAVMSTGGQRLEIFFIGGPAGKQPCDDNYSATAAESNQAVAFTIYDHPAPTPPNLGCAGSGYQRTVVVRLKRPLGPRVLVDSTDGGAIPVVRHATFGRPHATAP